jgi:Tfp pilus assembly major pilin PilA
MEQAMNNLIKTRQRGMTMIGLLSVGIVVAVAAVVGLQVVPTLIELQAITKAVNKASNGSTPAEVRTLFDKATQIDDIKSITGRDLEIVQEGGKTVVKFAYEREIHLVGPAYLTLKYAGRSK